MSALQVQLLYLVYPFCAATIRGEEPILSGTSTRDSLKKKIDKINYMIQTLFKKLSTLT